MRKKQEKNKSKQQARRTAATTNYPVGDFLIRVKNAALSGKNEVTLPKTKQIVEVAKMLAKEGYLSNIKVEADAISAKLAFKSKEPLLMGLKIVSKPGLRIYMGVKELKKSKYPSIFIVSTPRGVISSKEALKLGIGGEIIAEVW